MVGKTYYYDANNIIINEIEYTEDIPVNWELIYSNDSLVQLIIPKGYELIPLNNYEGFGFLSDSTLQYQFEGNILLTDKIADVEKYIEKNLLELKKVFPSFTLLNQKHNSISYVISGSRGGLCLNKVIQCENKSVILSLKCKSQDVTYFRPVFELIEASFLCRLR